MNTCTAEAAALAALNNAANQVYNIEGDQWQEAYETIEAVINKLNGQPTTSNQTNTNTKNEKILFVLAC